MKCMHMISRGGDHSEALRMDPISEGRAGATSLRLSPMFYYFFGGCPKAERLAKN